MRKAIAAILGLPVLGALYLGPVARRRALLRGAACLAVVGLFTIIAVSTTTTPAADAGKVATPDPAALSRISTNVVTGHGLTEPATIVFSERVDPRLVDAALRVTPAVAVRLTWSPDDTLLHVAPVGHWAPDTIYTIRLGTTAVGTDGSSLPDPLTAIFLTRPQTVASLQVDPAAAMPVATPAVTVSLSTPTTAVAVADALTVTPALPGRVTTVGPPQDALNTVYVWEPTAPLTPGTRYAVSLAPTLTDADGVPVAAGVSTILTAPSRPTVVRTRPLAGATAVALDQALSVRFSQAMDAATTEAAFHVSGVAAPAQAGRFSWAEGDTVLVWTPAAKLAYGTRYTITVDGTARAAAGPTLAADPTATVATASFTTLAKPRPAVRPVAHKDTPKASGSSTSSAPLYSVEKYFLSLVNCDHTGGWVSASGVCTGRGSNGHAALSLNAVISNGASRPWAKYLAQTSQLYHGDPGARLAAIGYTNAWWGENLAWWSGTATQGALKAVLFFQSEKAAKGGHYLNMMDTRARSAGVGAWQANGRVVFCIDFWA